MKETGIDCMKYRKSTHLAGVDVEMIIAEKGKCVLTIKESYYDTGVDVSGNRTDGYFLEFVEGVKPMVVNSTNRKVIASIVKIKNKCTGSESRNIGNWKGLSIELVFDESIKMMGKLTGGIRVSPISPIPTISDVNGKSILNLSKTLLELQNNWSKLSKQEQSLPSINALKDNLKTTLK
tara:strand:- start:1726 stop:2262 length:537 start_codon:yes stop_codon:yes gene_type:complete